MNDDLLPITSYTVNNPAAGTWTTIIEANAQTSVNGTPVETFLSMQSDLRLTIPVARDARTILRPITITAQLRNSSTAISGASVTASLIRPDKIVTPITLLDDGQHGDGTAGDGIYGYQFTPTIPGVYSAIISASSTLNGTPFSRSNVWAAQIDGEQQFLPLLSDKNNAPAPIPSNPAPTALAPTVTSTAIPSHPATPTNTPTPTSSPTPTNTPTPTPVTVSIEVPIRADNLDGYEDPVFHISGDGYNNNYVGTDTSVMMGWIFSNLQIPKGARITDAYVRFRGFGIGGDATARIQAFAQDNASAFTSDGVNKPSTRSATNAFVDWPDSWSFKWQWFQTPNIASVVQEVVDRSGWQVGNSLGLRISNPTSTGINWAVADYAAGPYDGSEEGSGHSVTLYITYSK